MAPGRLSGSCSLRRHSSSRLKQVFADSGLQQAGRVEGPDVALFPGGTPKPTAVGFQGVSHCENGQMQLEASEKGSRES
jgi:hypothetical protein